MKEFERDSKLPFWVIFGGEVIACFATWYAVHSVWGMCGHAGFDWCGHEASMMFKAARGSIVLSAMLSGGLAILIRLARAKEASVLGYLTAYVKLALALFVAMRISAVVGFAMGAFVPLSCEPMMAFGGWRCFQLAHVVSMVVLIPAGLCFMELAQKRLLAARTWLGRGVVCAMLATPALTGQCLWMLDWVEMVKLQETREEVPQTSPFENYRLTEDEPGEVMG